MPTYKEFKIPLANLSFHPDVPSAAQSANEYNNYDSRNVETDVRGIRSILGDQEILAAIPGTPLHISGGYRDDEQWYYIIGTLVVNPDSSLGGKWFYILNNNAAVDITPGVAQDPDASLPGYYEGMDITDSWNGTTLFINDGVTAPMFLTGYGDEFIQYSQYGDEFKSIGNITGDGTTVEFEYFTAETDQAPFEPGQQITVTGVDPDTYDGIQIPVESGNLTQVSIASDNTDAYVDGGRIYPSWEWNYNPLWKTLTAGFMRVYNSPNVGSIMIAGNLTATDFDDNVENYPNTVRWSQAFGLNDAPQTWRPTLSNVANELEVPVRGPLLDGFNLNGNFYVMSYWDTVVFSPINYQTTAVPILGVRLVNQGRGLLNANCWTAGDDVIFGVDARDIWVFNGNQFKGIGNQRIKNWFYSQINPDYVDRVFMENNTAKNQIEIYYPDLDSTGWCNKMISYRYDLDIWNAPRDVSDASSTVEGPYWTSGDYYDLSLRTVVYVRGAADSNIVQKDTGFTFINDEPITSVWQRDNIQIMPNYSQQLLVHRVLPAVNNIDGDSIETASTGTVDITVGGSNGVGETVTDKNTVTFDIGTGDPWVQVNQNAFRVNSIRIENTSSNTAWYCSSLTWQVQPTEDSR